MYNLLETTRGKRVTTELINKLSNYLNSYQDMLHITDNVVAVLGRDALEKDLPKWSGVIPVQDKQMIDLSLYFSKSLNYGLPTEQLIHTAILAHHYQEPKDMPHSLAIGYVDIATALISNTLLQFLILNNDEYMYVKAISEYHFKYMVEDTSLDRAKLKATRTADMTQLGDEVLNLTEPDGTLDKLILHINMLGNLLQRDKLSVLTKNGLSILVSKGWISKDPINDIMTAFEHPPSMYAVVHAGYSSSLFKRSNITQILKNGKVVNSLITKHLESVLKYKE